MTDALHHHHGLQDGPLVAVAFDFAGKELRAVSGSEVRAEIAAGRYVWADLDCSDAAEARRILGELALCDAEITEGAFGNDPATQLSRYDDCLHVVLSGCRMSGKAFELERVDAVFGHGFLLTLRHGHPGFMRAIRRDYRSDFLRFAQSPSFLMYELWDHLIENYLAVHKAFEDRVEEVQRSLVGEVDEGVFADATELSSDLLQLRKVLLPARAVLTDLSTRKSAFVSEHTQPYLMNMVGTVEHVLQDVLVDRDILSDSLNNYMSMVAHRTSRVMGKLTVVSVIFLPLTFLCGVYGMNFEVLPELKLEWGYGAFWVVVLTIVLGLIGLMRRMKLL